MVQVNANLTKTTKKMIKTENNRISVSFNIYLILNQD